MVQFSYKWLSNKHEANVKGKMRSRVYDIKIKNYERLSGVSYGNLMLQFRLR